jgi:hypothetical protein
LATDVFHGFERAVLEDFLANFVPQILLPVSMSSRMSCRKAFLGQCLQENLERGAGRGHHQIDAKLTDKQLS